jgi:hypothetical protein
MMARGPHRFSARTAYLAMLLAIVGFALPAPPAEAQGTSLSVFLCGTRQIVTIELPGDGSKRPIPAHGGKACHVCDLRQRRSGKSSPAAP